MGDTNIDTCKLHWLRKGTGSCEYELRNVMTEVDNAFVVPVFKRSNGEELFRKILKNAEVLVAYMDHSVVGYTAMYANDSISKMAYITLIGVHPDYQRMGIGAKMLQECEKRAITFGMTKIKLEVKTANTASSFYYKQGYYNVGDTSKDSSFFEKSI